MRRRRTRRLRAGPSSDVRGRDALATRIRSAARPRLGSSSRDHEVSSTVFFIVVTRVTCMKRGALLDVLVRCREQAFEFLAGCWPQHEGERRQFFAKAPAPRRCVPDAAAQQFRVLQTQNGCKTSHCRSPCGPPRPADRAAAAAGRSEGRLVRCNSFGSRQLHDVRDSHRRRLDGLPRPRRCSESRPMLDRRHRCIAAVSSVRVASADWESGRAGTDVGA